MAYIDSQYRKLDQNALNIEWSNATKYNNFAKIKYMLNADFININDNNIHILFFRVSYNDDPKYVKTLKYFLSHYETNNKTINPDEWQLFLNQVCVNDNLSVFKTVIKHNKTKNITFDKDMWEQLLNAACLSNGDRVLKQIFKNYDFTYEQLSNEFTSTIKNLPAFELFASKLDVTKEVKKNDFLQKVVSEQCLQLVAVLINTYQIDFTFFKALALENVSKPDGDKIFELIKIQSLFNSLNNDLVNDKKIRSLKI